MRSLKPEVTNGKSLFLDMQSKPILLFCFIILMGASKNLLAQIPLVAGMQLTKSQNILPGIYQLASKNLSTKDVITITGKNIVLDGMGATLRGTAIISKDSLQGIAIYIAPGSENICIKNLHIEGYPITILADRVKGLEIQDLECNLLNPTATNSVVQNSDSSNIIIPSFAQAKPRNPNTIGIKIYQSEQVSIHKNSILGQENGLVLEQCHGIKIFDNSIEQHANWGIGMLQSDSIWIYHNQLNQHQTYYQQINAAQNTIRASIYLSQSCKENIIAYNNAMYAINGIIMDSNTADTILTKNAGNNLVFGNDFSFALHAGLLVSGGGNTILQNKIMRCKYGIKAGNSYDSDFSDNQILENRYGITIESGWANNIALNLFQKNDVALQLGSDHQWIKDSITSQRLYRSDNYWIAANRFITNTIVYQLEASDTLVFSGNKKLQNDSNWVLGEHLQALDSTREADELDLEYDKDKRLKAIPDSSRPSIPNTEISLSLLWFESKILLTDITESNHKNRG